MKPSDRSKQSTQQALAICKITHQTLCMSDGWTLVLAGEPISCKFLVSLRDRHGYFLSPVGVGSFNSAVHF